MKDVAIVGGGIAGMATAARLQAQGLSTVVLEAHGMPGGCAGYFHHRGFSFDVGATTLVDFDAGGLGGDLLQSIGMEAFAGEALPGYVAWLPDRVVPLHQDQDAWARERLKAFGDTSRHRRFWSFLDDLAGVFWKASRRGAALPFRCLRDITQAVGALGVSNIPKARYLLWTMGDALRAFGLREDRALVGLLSMLIEDTVHSSVDEAPLINAALGITIRGAGLTRARGGMRGFWQAFAAHYRCLGGELKVGHCAEGITGSEGAFCIRTKRGDCDARQVVCALPAPLAARLGPEPVGEALAPYLRRDAAALGGAIVLFLGVPESDVLGQDWTHHQILSDYSSPLGNGNNMFISVSSPGDTESAPPGCRAVMISTHCDLEDWDGLPPDSYQARKQAMGERLVGLARRVYPHLGKNPCVYQVGTPQTYARFTHRPRGAVGGVRLSLANANHLAIPHDLGLPGYHLVGDTTWPGLGTVACVLGSRIVAEQVLRRARSRGLAKLETSHANQIRRSASPVA